MARHVPGPAPSQHLAKVPKSGSSKKKQARKDRLVRQKERNALVAAANAQQDLLSGFEPFRQFKRNGLDVRIESVSGEQLAASDLSFCIGLLHENMAAMYEKSSWGWNEAEKRSGLSERTSRVLMLRAQAEAPSAPEDDWVMVEYPDRTTDVPHPRPERNVGFVHLQFTIEDERAVMYVLEMQLAEDVRGKGLGKFAMQLCELIACKHRMQSMMLTVFKSNDRALDFYRQKLRYSVDDSSPSQWQRDEDYEILSKTFESAAKQEV